MSAGPFQTGFYVDDFDVTHFVRAQPETAEATFDGVVNAYPEATPLPSTFTLRTSVRNQRAGINARYVTVKLTANGTGQRNEYRAGSDHQITVFDKAIFDAIVKNSEATYLGIAAVVISKSSENRC